MSRRWQGWFPAPVSRWAIWRRPSPSDQRRKKKPDRVGPRRKELPVPDRPVKKKNGGEKNGELPIKKNELLRIRPNSNGPNGVLAGPKPANRGVRQGAGRHIRRIAPLTSTLV